MRMLSEKEERVLQAIVAAAEAGRACPSNPEICGIIDAASVSAGAGIIARLERYGIISVSRYQVARQVTVLATGKSTFVPAGQRQPHWRERGVVRRTPSKVAQRDEAAAMPDEDLPPRIDREPCPRCGVRADFGCQHSTSRISMGAFA